MKNPMCNHASFLAFISKSCRWKRCGLRLAPLFLAIATSVLTGCGSLETVAPVVVSAPGADAGTLADGRRIYTQACTACHAAEAVSAYTEAQWRTILPDMIERTKLDPAQSHAVSAYVHAALRIQKTAAR